MTCVCIMQHQAMPYIIANRAFLCLFWQVCHVPRLMQQDVHAQRVSCLTVYICWGMCQLRGLLSGPHCLSILQNLRNTSTCMFLNLPGYILCSLHIRLHLAGNPPAGCSTALLLLGNMRSCEASMQDDFPGLIEHGGCHCLAKCRVVQLQGCDP